MDARLKRILMRVLSDIQKYSSTSEAFASELLENLEYMFPQYYIHSDKRISDHTILC